MEVLKALKMFGNNVYTNRVKMGMTIKELSKVTGIRESYLRKIEKGEAKGMPAHYVFLFANAFKMKPYEICEGI